MILNIANNILQFEIYISNLLSVRFQFDSDNTNDLTKFYKKYFITERTIVLLLLVVR